MSYSPTRRQATYDDILALPQHVTGQIVDPAARTLEVYELSTGRWTLLGAHEGDEIVRAAPFGEIGIPLADLWVGDATGPSQTPSPSPSAP